MASQGRIGGPRRGHTCTGRGERSVVSGAAGHHQRSIHRRPRPTAEAVEQHSQNVAKRMVLVRELYHHSTEENICEYFKQFGEVVGIHIMRFPTGVSRRKAFVTFFDEEAVKEVLSGERGKTQGHSVDGTRVFVQRYHLPPNKRWVPNMLKILIFVDTSVQGMDGIGPLDINEDAIMTREINEWLRQRCGDKPVNSKSENVGRARTSSTKQLTVWFSGMPLKAYERILIVGEGSVVAGKYSIRSVERQRAWTQEKSKVPAGHFQRENSEGKTRSMKEKTHLVTHMDKDYFEGLVHLQCSADSLPAVDGVQHTCRIFFNNQFKPHLICILNRHDLPVDEDYSTDWLRCPVDVAVLWLQRMFAKGEEVVERCKHLTTRKGKQYKQYYNISYTLNFDVGRFQTGKKWLGHIVLPLHAYYLYRLHWYQHRSHNALPWEEPWVEPEDKAAALATSGDTVVLRQCPCPLSSASHPNIKEPTPCRWFAMEEWTTYCEKNSEIVAENLKEFEKQTESSESLMTADLQGMGEGSANAFASSHPAFVLPLAQPSIESIDGLEMSLTLDKHKARNPTLTIELLQHAPLKSADHRQLHQVVLAIHKLCNHLKLVHFRLSFGPENEISLLMGNTDFCRFLSPKDFRRWKSFKWQNVPGPSFISMDDLDKSPPGP